MLHAVAQSAAEGARKRRRTFGLLAGASAALLVLLAWVVLGTDDTVRASGVPLSILALVGAVLALLFCLIHRQVVQPAERVIDELSAADALLRSIVGDVPQLAVFKVVLRESGETRTEFVSRGTVAVIGVPAVAIAADWSHAFDAIAEEDVDAAREGCARALVECTTWTAEFRVRQRSEERWVRVEARANRLADAVELLGSWRDVTGARHDAARLADAQQRVTDLADSVPGAVIQWQATADGRQDVSWVGRRLVEVAGIGAAELGSGFQAFERVLHEDDTGTVRAARVEAAATNTGYAVEYRVRHAQRGIRWLREEGVANPAAGTGAAFTVYLSDVTRERQEAAELRRAKEEAESATRAKSVFLATMSHEIRTPMSGVSGMIEVLARSALDAEQRQALMTIADSARTLRRILDDVLDFSRVEAGKMTIERRPIAMDEIVEATAGLSAAAAGEKGLQLRTTVDPRLGELLMGDTVRLRQVLGNLLSNAVKFTRRGEVRIAVTQESVTDSHCVLLFDVSDTGVGIPYEVQGRLFAPFERGTHEATTHVGGTGLGLALVRRIVELMDGTVELRSIPGVGTSVRVRLPFERVHEETSESRIWLTGLDVVVLHEVEADSRHLATLLERRGARVTSLAPDGISAAPEELPTDVIVTGPEVPREVLHAVRLRVAHGRSGRTQVLRLTDGGSLRAELRADGDVMIAPHARRSAFLHAVAIAGGRDSIDQSAEVKGTRAHSRQPAPPVHEAMEERRLILVCEDHPIAKRVIERQLGVLGHTAELVSDGQQGLHAWRTGRYGLVLTDLQMPEMDGLALARAIRAEEQADPTLGRTPIIALSGNAFDEQRVDCVEAGMDDFLAKPALLKELDATLRFWLPPSTRPAREGEPSAASSAVPVNLPAPLSHEALHENLGDDPEMLRQAIGEFIAADTDDFAALYAAVESDDRGRVMSAAHRIEGAARMLGAMPYARAAERVKRLFGSEQESALRVQAVHRLQQEGERLRTWLHTTRDYFERVAVSTTA